MKGMKLWVMTLVEYDAYGNASVLQSFCKPAHDSPIKKKDKKERSSSKRETVKQGEKQLWE